MIVVCYYDRKHDAIVFETRGEDTGIPPVAMNATEAHAFHGDFQRALWQLREERRVREKLSGNSPETDTRAARVLGL